MKVYLIVLSGQGDTIVKVVDKASYDWITGPVVGEFVLHEMEDTLCPEVQRNLIGEVPSITSGSPENDRALECRSTNGYGRYISITKATKAILKKGDKLAGDYEGFIY